MFFRAVSALGNYLAEPGDRNLLGFKVQTEHKPSSLWQHWMAGAPKPPPPPPTPEPPPPTVIYNVTHEHKYPPPPKPAPPPPPPPPRPPTRMQRLAMIEREYQEDLQIAEQFSDPMTTHAALVQAENKRRRRIAHLIG